MIKSNTNTFKKTNKKTLSILLLLIAPVLWGVMFMLGSQSMKSIHPFYLSAIRYFIASLTLLPFLLLKEGLQSLKINKQTLQIAFFGIVGIAGTNLLMWYGIMLTSDLLGAVMDALIPITSLLLYSLICRKIPSLQTLGIVFISFIGVALVISKGSLTFLQNASLPGVFVLYLSTIFWVFYSLGNRVFKDISSLRFTTISATYASLFMIVFDFVLCKLSIIPVLSWNSVEESKWSLLYIGVVASCLAVLFWNIGLKNLGIVHGSLFINLIPISTLLANIFTGKSFDIFEFIGCFLTIVCILMNYIAILKNKET